MRSAARSVKAVFGAALLCVYGALCLISYFPALHNHVPLARAACCGNDKANCDISHKHDHHTPGAALRSGGDNERAHGACIACRWQAMAKKPASTSITATDSSRLTRQSHTLTEEILYDTASLLLQQPRAPPS
jgi:hypothetical protein